MLRPILVFSLSLDQAEQKKMIFIVATNIVTSRPPERRPTRTPHARANLVSNNKNIVTIIKIVKVGGTEYWVT